MILLYIVVAILLSTLLLAINLYRKFPAVGSKLLFTSSILVFLWFLLDALILFGFKPHYILQMHALKYLFIVAIPILFLFITIAYTNSSFLLSKINKLFFWIIPTIVVIMIASNHKLGLVWSTLEVVQVGRYFAVIPQNAIIFWVHATYSYSLILLGFILLMHKYIKSPPIYRKQSGFLLVGCSIAWLLNILFVWGYNYRYLFDPSPLSSLMIIFVFYWGLFKYGSQRIVPIVRDLIVENMEDMILVLDNSDLIIEMNPSLKKGLRKIGITTNFIGSTMTTLLSRVPNFSEVGMNYSGKTNVILGHGENTTYYEVEKTAVLDKDQHQIGSLIILHDITSIQKVMKKLEYMTSFDQLTGLYNRAFFEIELERLDTDRQLPISFIVGDVNGLKMTNDAFGHAVGDRLLQKVSETIKGAMRTEDICARTGGDEFCIILPQTTEQEARKIIDRLNKICDEIYDKPIVRVSVSWGLASKTSSKEDIQRVLKRADAGMYKKKLLESKSTHGEIVTSLINTLKESSFETNEHAERMKALSYQLGIKLHLSESQMDDLLLLALLHDLGKVGVPNSILEKPSKLTEEEWEIMKRHTEIGYHIASSSNDLSHIAEAILSHHERWDGKGYPRKLSGNQIPYLARIISVLDSYDVMTNERIYKKSIPKEEALLELQTCSGTQFDPKITQAFCSLIQGIIPADIDHKPIAITTPYISVVKY